MKENRKIYSFFFISVYFLFLVISSLHYHQYDLNKLSEYKDQQKENSALALDFLSDGSGICAVNHFSHSILNFSTTSEELNVTLPKHKSKITDINISYSLPGLLNNLSPRASPVNS